MVIHTCKWRHCVACSPTKIYLMVFGKSQKIYISEPGFAFFLPSTPRSPPSFILSKISVSYLFSSDQEIQNPCSTTPTTRKPSRRAPPSVCLGWVEVIPRAAWSPWSRSSDEPPSVIIRRQAARTSRTMNRLQPSLKKSLSISVSPALDLTSLCWLCLEARHQEPLMLHLYPHSVKEDTQVL